MFLSFDERMPDFHEYIVAYGNNEKLETMEVDDISAKRAYNSVKNWLSNTNKQVYGVYAKTRNSEYNQPVLLVNEMGEYV